MIKSLSSSSIHRICSSQVITSLGTAVKELVENSLDAGASKIDILLKNYGKDSITVSDNGIGIDPKDFELIAKKHATSKIEEFDDLESLKSFGFRGEALSSLCGISGDNLIITTKLKKELNIDPFGYELEYNKEGDLIKNTKIAYSKCHGTSIIISKLFKTLPVRFKDFTKNIKKEYSNLLSILQSYGIIQTNVNFIVRNDNKIILNTSNNSNNNNMNNNINNNLIRNNIGNIFGWKLIEKLIQINNQKIELNDNTIITLNGFISNEMMEYGRTKSDIQFFYVNKRPIDIGKIQKLINQIYKSNINKHKYPIIVLNIELLTDKYDINIDPNKRSVIIQNEYELMEKLKTFFQKLYEPNNMSYNVKSLDSFISIKNNNHHQSNYNVSNRNNRKRKFSERDDDDDDDDIDHDQYPKSSTSEDHKEPPPKFRRGTNAQKIGIRNINDINEINNNSDDDMEEDEDTVSELNDDEDDDEDIDINIDIDKKKKERLSQYFMSEQIANNNNNKPLRRQSRQRSESVHVENKDNNDLESGIYEQDEYSLSFNKNRFISAFRALIGFREHYERDIKLCLSPIKKPEKGQKNDNEIDYGDDDDDDNTLDLSLAKMKRIFNKNDSINLQIIGQFNAGFIIGKLKNDIFIIDQHATDEKYRFENLMKKCKIKSQPLLIPKYINCLTLQQEIAIIENMDIFESNGFKFSIDDNGNNGNDGNRNRIKIVSLPMSLNPHSKISYEFGEDEILELATILSENTVCSLINNGGIIRPSKVRTVFAYKACRGAIMIGKALTKQEMRSIVNNINTLDQPWNCPHGRPTMRHLFDLSLLDKHFKDKGQINQFGPFAFA